MPSFFPMVAVTLEVRAKLAPKLAPRLLEAVLPTALATEAVFPNVLVIPLAIDLLLFQLVLALAPILTNGLMPAWALTPTLAPLPLVLVSVSLVPLDSV